MKKLSAIIIAIALVLGMSQCKKQETPTSTDNPEGMVYITVNVDGNGAKHTVYPNHGLYGFDNGDLLYVGNNDRYIGTLTYNNGAFSGGIYEPSTSDYLHFYFLGGKGPQAPEVGTESFTIDIVNQTDNLPILSYGHSAAKYTDANATYSTVLKNKCALVKFGLNKETDEDIEVAGLLTSASINFNLNGVEPIVADDAIGTITLYNPATPEGSNERWAILLDGSDLGGASSINGEISIEGEAPAVTNNGYVTTGITIIMQLSPTGTINGLFSVSATQQVYFSQGNLQYSISENKWSFMEHQYDIVETPNTQIGIDYADQDIISLFSWGTSGYNHGATIYQPWKTSGSNNNFYAYGNQSNNLYDQTGQADWGYNAIVNGGNQEHSGWRTLTSNEWKYVCNTRTGAASKRGHANVNGMNGMILLPDEWTLPEGLTFTAGNGTSWAVVSNVYSAEQWAQMEANGAIFLPAAGTRNGNSVSAVGTYGQYWSSSIYSGTHAYYLDISGSGYNPLKTMYRRIAHSVRLVLNAE